MNKITSLFSVLVFCFCFAYNAKAQVSTSNYEQPSCVSPQNANHLGKVTPDNLYFVSYHPHQNKNELILTEISNPANSQKIILPNRFSANDMFILFDWVYLCGAYNGIAAIAKLRLVDFNNPYPQIYISTFQEPETFTKFEIYTDESGEKHITAVGHINTSNDNTTYVYDTYLLTMTETNDTINYNLHRYTGGGKRLYHDVAVTNNYIVAAGLPNMTNYLGITVVDKTMPNFFNWIFYNESSTTINSTYVDVETLTGDLVAITTMCISPNNDLFTRVYIFDAATSTILYSQDVPLPEKYDVIEMEYLNDTAHTLLLLQENYYPIGDENSLFYFIRPFNTSSYNTSFFYNPDSKYYSLDHFNDGRFLATGELKTGGHAYMIGLKDPNTIPNCTTVEPVKIDINDVLDYYIYPVYGNSHQTLFFPVTVYSVQTSIKNTCSD